MSYTIKRKTLRAFFAIELVLFVWSYAFGTHGLYALWILGAECKAIKHKIELAHAQQIVLQQQIDQLKSDPFYTERIARDQLNMARADELTYFL